MADLFHHPAWWGVLGAIVYAAPRLSICLFSAHEAGSSRFACVFDFAIALIVGAIGAAVLPQWMVAWRGLSSERDLNILAVATGMLANRVAPILINDAPRLLANIFSGRLLRALKGDDA